MKKRTNISLLAMGAVLLAGTAQADKWSDMFPHIKNSGDIPGECSYESMSKKDYSGRKLTINTHAVPVMGEPTALHAEQFAKLTGAEVNVIHTPAGDLYSKAMVPFQTGQAPYDIVFGFSQGTMMALHVIPRRDEAIAGLVVFSGQLLEPEALVDDARAFLPILLVHGDQDDVVPIAALPKAVEGLQAAGFKDVYAHVMKDGAHGIAPDGLQVALAFMRKQFGME